MSWENKILESFPTSLEQILLVTDPDEVLKEEKLLKKIIEKGFILLDLDDPVSFRYLFETNFRYSDAQDRLIIRIENDDFNQFPYEYLRKGYRISLQLDEFFPKINYSVTKQLDPESLKLLYEAYKKYSGEILGERGTARFILKNVYGINPGSIEDKTELFRQLFRLHLNDINIPKIFVKFLLQDLKFNEEEIDFSLENAFMEREFFFDILQKQWEVFIGDLQNKTRKSSVPFDKSEIRVYMDSLFLEGLLKPVETEKKIDDLPYWVQLGIKTDENRIKRNKFSELLSKLENFLSEGEIDYKKWFQSAQLLGEAQVLLFHNKDELPRELKEKYRNIHREIEEKFSHWLLESFGSLINLPYTKRPVMVHHIPWHMDYLRNKRDMEKLALVVIDGLSVVHWGVIKEFLSQKIDDLNMEEKLSYAWVPTTTSISRQAIFSGELPAYFKDSIGTTQKEEKLWKKFWQNRGLKYSNIKYMKGLGKGKKEDLNSLFEDPRTRVLGLVVDIIDKMTHGEHLGMEGLLRDIRFWMEKGYLIDLLKNLFAHGYEVFLTSDHGSVLAEGQGRPNQGVLVDNKGERTRVYSDTAFIDQVKEDYNSIEWPGLGLPENMHVLLASSGKAFVQEGKQVLSHGGISIEEVIVPFIRLWEEKKNEAYRF